MVYYRPICPCTTTNNSSLLATIAFDIRADEEPFFSSSLSSDRHLT